MKTDFSRHTDEQRRREIDECVFSSGRHEPLLVGVDYLHK
jgi:hypothetical protein